MPRGKMIETIENDWDALFRDYPEVYDEFARVEMRPPIPEIINAHFPLKGKVVLDVGSGTGAPTFKLAGYASSVIGVEPERSMRDVAVSHAREKAIPNVEFLDGRAEAVPLPDHSVDMVLAVTLQTLHNEENIRRFAQEAERVVRPGGSIVSVNIPPGWYGGELCSIIFGEPRRLLPDEEERDKWFAKLGFRYRDFDCFHDYGSVEKAVRTYGFIFGRKAIDYIKENEKTVIKFRYRMHYKSC
jgi:ubiquinone/menaquinone biosynthesis C-methylase UbiE